MAILIVDDADNDLVFLARLLQIEFDRCPRSQWVAASQNRKYKGVLLCAADYPRPNVLAEDEKEQLQLFCGAQDRAYIEFTTAASGEDESIVRKAPHERLISTSQTDLTVDLPPLTILEEHESLYVQLPTSGKPVLLYGRVAGVHQAVFGLSAQTWPGMVLDGNLLMSALCASRYRRLQFKLERNWRMLLSRILLWTAGQDSAPVDLPSIVTSITRPTISSMPQKEAYAQCIRGNVRWYLDNGMLPRHDGMMGVCEGYWGVPDPSGRHTLKRSLRPDCMTESAYAFTLATQLGLADENLKGAAENITDFVINHTQFANPESPVYGLFTQHINRKLHLEQNPDLTRIASHDWSASWIDAFDLEKSSAQKYPSYVPADDNGWVVLMLLEMYRRGGRRDWLDSAMRAAEAMRYNQFGYPGIMGAFINPHAFSMPQAAYLYIYGLTRRQEYLDAAERSIHWVAEQEPNWYAVDTVTTEHVRFLLPLVLAYYYTGQSRYAELVERSLDHVIRHQHECGAILHDPAEPRQVCKSNEDYGTDEGAIIQTGEEKITDMLYCNGFALMNLYLTWKITRNDRAKQAFIRLANFLCAVQINSERWPWLSGTWMRGFDVDHWEYFGSNHDYLWGPYCVETGWCNAIISMTLSCYLLDVLPLPAPNLVDNNAIQVLDQHIRFFRTFVPNRALYIPVHM